MQQALLKLIEGSIVPVPRGMGMKYAVPGTSVDTIDTTNILFIGAGSFAGIEEVVARRLNKRASLGFGSEKRQKLEEIDVYRQVEIEDVEEFGLIPEIVGRMPVLTSTYELSEDEMVAILTKPQNAIVKQFQALYAIDKIELSFDEGALRAIAKMAKKHPTGARALRAIVKRVLKPYSFESPSDPTISSIQITEEAVEHPGKGIIMRGRAGTGSLLMATS